MALSRPVKVVDVWPSIWRSWKRGPTYPVPLEMAAYQYSASALSSHSSTTLFEVVSSQDTPAEAVTQRTVAAVPQPPGPPDCTVMVCVVPDAKPINVCTTAVRSPVQSPPPALARYLDAPVTAPQDTVTLFDVAVHDRTGAAMPARVVQYTPAKFCGLLFLTASTLTQYFVEAASPVKVAAVDAVDTSVCALPGSASWIFAE
ncbi:MAG: hypothetical protein OXF00_10200 [bacterium]|nr:hypothetical protein [bacterium]